MTVMLTEVLPLASDKQARANKTNENPIPQDWGICWS